MNKHSYTAEQIEFLKSNRPNMTANELSIEFAQRFDTIISAENLKRACIRNGIRSLNDGRFQKNNLPHNAGKKHPPRGRSVETLFKKGSRPHNTLPIGTVAWKGRNHKTGDIGYLAVKIAEPNIWEYLHHQAWQRQNGTIPARCAIIFLDGNRENLAIANLALVTRAELSRLNHLRYSQQPAELKPAVFTLAKLKAKVGSLRKANND